MAKQLSSSHRRIRRKRSAAKPWPLVTLWLDNDVEAHFRRGRGWQSRINAALRKAAKLPGGEAEEGVTLVGWAKRSEPTMIVNALALSGHVGTALRAFAHPTLAC